MRCRTKFVVKALRKKLRWQRQPSRRVGIIEKVLRTSNRKYAGMNVMKHCTTTRLTKNPWTSKIALQREESLALDQFGVSRFSHRILLISALAGAMLLSACGGSSSGSGNSPQQLAGNWQFSLTNPDATGGYTGQYGLQGGFLLVKSGKVTGQIVYSLSGISESNGTWAICDSGSAPNRNH